LHSVQPAVMMRLRSTESHFQLACIASHN